MLRQRPIGRRGDSEGVERGGTGAAVVALAADQGDEGLDLRAVGRPKPVGKRRVRIDGATHTFRIR